MSALEELFEVLRAMSEQESYEVLRHTRASVNPEAILNQVRDGNLLMQLSLVPERRRRYEFPYLHEMPTFLLQPENPYTDTFTCDYSFKVDVTLQNRQCKAYNDPRAYQDLHWDPYHAAEVVDPRLESIKSST